MYMHSYKCMTHIYICMTHIYICMTHIYICMTHIYICMTHIYICMTHSFMYDTYYINIILIICNQPATGNFGQFVMAECLRFAMLRLSAISSPKKHPLFDRWRRTGVAGGASFPCCPRNDGGIGMPCVLVQEWYRIQGTPWGKRNDLPEDFSISVMVSDLVGGIIKDIALLTACLPISCCF